MPLLDPHMAEKIGTLQLLDDAIAYRLDKLNLSCPKCRPGARCAAHHYDEQLVTGYMDRYSAALSDALAGMDPGDIAVIMTQLRELAATGPVIVELDSGTGVIEQDGPVLAEYRLTSGFGR
jgi:hypothetical protein